MSTIVEPSLSTYSDSLPSLSFSSSSSTSPTIINLKNLKKTSLVKAALGAVFLWTTPLPAVVGLTLHQTIVRPRVAFVTLRSHC